jgi:small-conductance mechanosensitive channel
MPAGGRVTVLERLTSSENPVLSALWGWLTEPLFSIGDASFTTASVLKMLVFLVLLVWGARLVRRMLRRRILPQFKVEPGVAYAISNVTSYIILFIGLLAGLQASGIDLSTVTVIFGALGIGVGFGLQNIASNFVSGLIIHLERPIEVGDRIQIGELHARVVRIKARATEVLTNDNISVIVPNSEIISQQVVNWSHETDRMRIKIPVPVAYGSDVATVKKALLEAAANVPAILKDPAPRPRLKGFGDSSLEFELLVWTSEMLHRRGECISQVNYAIYEAFLKHGIRIPFPQRDLHLISAAPLPVVRTGEAGET